MGNNKIYTIIEIAIILTLGYLTYLIFNPFLIPLAWATILSIVLYPLYSYLSKILKHRHTLSSLATIFIVFLFITGPFSYIIYSLINELETLSNNISIEEVFKNKHLYYVVKPITDMFNISESELNKIINEHISSISKEIIVKLGDGLNSVLNSLIDFIFMLIFIFFMLTTGNKLLQKLRDYLPFSDEQKFILSNQVKDTVISTVFGGVIFSIIQGAIGGIAFWFLNLSSPVLYGLLISLTSFIPLIGSAIVWLPMSIYLLLEGAFLKGIILIIIGICIILIDNILRPIILGNKMKMPFIIILISVLGGIKVFGLVGLIMGPLVISLFVSIINVKVKD